MFFAFRVIEIYLKQAKFLAENHDNSQESEKILDTFFGIHVC
jgi:hypothetical protein